MDGDGHLDVLIGNDLGVPDYYYLGIGKGGLKQSKVEDKILPHSTETTMSISVADIDNNLAPEIYVSEIARGIGKEFASNLEDVDVACDAFEGDEAQDKCRAAMSEYRKLPGSQRPRDDFLREYLQRNDWQAECVGINLLRAQATIKSDNGFDPALCNVIPMHKYSLRSVCLQLSKPVVKNPWSAFESALPRVQRRNVLLVGDGSGGYRDEAEECGVALGGWSWNAKFADLDKVGWKDLYIANGWFPSKTRESNMFYRNGGDGRFGEKTESFGLRDFRVTTSYSCVDFDNDCDLDRVTVPVYGNA